MCKTVEWNVYLKRVYEVRLRWSGGGGALLMVVHKIMETAETFRDTQIYGMRRRFEIVTVFRVR